MRQFSIALLLFIGISAFSQSTYRFEHLTVDDGLSRNTVTAIIKDSKGFMWFGTYNGLNRYDGYTFQVYKKSLKDSTSISNSRVVQTVKDEDGNVWFLTFDNIYNKYNYETDDFSRYNATQLPDEFLNKFQNQNSVKESENILWEAIGSRGLVRRNPATGGIENFTQDPFDEHSLNDNNIMSLYLDSADILWIGTTSGGVNKLDLNQKQFNNYKHNPLDENSLQSPNIRAISEDNIGNLWVGTHGSGICKIERSTNLFTRIRAEDGVLVNDNIRALYTDSRGYVWIGFTQWNSIQRINPNDGEINTFSSSDEDSSSFNRQNVYTILEDEYGLIWFGGFGGLSKFDPETESFKNYTRYGEEPFLSSDRVRVIYQDNSQNVWIGTEGGGINKMTREFAGTADEKISFEHFLHNPKDTNSLSDNSVYSICEDNNGIMWIGTALGLNRYDPFNNEFLIFSEETGLPDDMIYGILKDNNDNLWLSHSKGISNFDSKTNRIIRNYKKTDGLQGNQFSEDAYYKSPKGEMFFGGLNGLTYFFPDSIKPNYVPPRVVFTSFSVLDKEVEIGGKTYGRVILDKHISETKEIELDFAHKSFTIEFAALQFSDPLNNCYEYKLEPFEKQWLRTDVTKKSATYSNLKAKDYTFMVRAANSDNVKSLEPIELKIHINPPFWRTWYFYLSIAALLALAIIYIIKRREKTLEKDKRVLKEKISAVQKEVDQQKEEIVMQKQELKLRAQEEKDMRWYNEGLAKFSEIISKNKGNVKKLTQAIISELVNYLGADQGGIFLLNDQNEDDMYFELIGSFAYDGQKLKAGRIELEEGQIGACYKEKNILQINNLPETYTSIRSGLGKKSPRFLILSPLKNDDEVLGVIEIASFIRVKGVRVVFLEKLAENISAVIAAEKATEKMHILYKKSQEQTEILAKKEEEMRRTLEEVQAANDGAALRERELLNFADEAADREEQMNAKLTEKDDLIKELKEKLKGDPNSET